MELVIVLPLELKGEGQVFVMLVAMRQSGAIRQHPESVSEVKKV